MAKRQDVLSLRIPVPLALPAAPNPKAANTPLMTSVILQPPVPTTIHHVPGSCWRCLKNLHQGVVWPVKDKSLEIS